MWIGIGASSLLLAQGSQSGSFSGTVTAGGVGLPGVTVTVESPALQGKRTQTTGAQGDYIFKFLPPGAYKITFELSGMRTVVQQAKLELGAVARADAVLEPAATEAVTVTATTREIDKTAVHESNYDDKQVQALPVLRTIDQIAALAPAVTQNTPNAGQLKINGGFAYDNVFLLDGADIDDHYFSSPTNALVIEDAVQETQVLSSNISAEYGRFTGGIVNAVTKSGGNQYHGTFRTDFSNDRWKARTPFENDAANGVPEAPNKTNETYSATFGGKIVEDKLWFFVAGRYFDNSTQTVLPVTGDTFQASDKEPRIEAKLTGNINESHSLSAAYTYSKEERNDVAFDFTIDPFAQETPSFPTDLWVATYHGVLTPNLFVSLQYSQKKFEFQGSGGTSTNIVDSPFISTFPTLAEYNAPYFDATDPEHRNNRQWTGSVNYFLTTSKLGTHDLKLGGELFRTTEIGGNSQSATNYVFYYNPYVRDANGKPIKDANGRIQPIFTGFDGTAGSVNLLLNWLPIRGATANQDTNSAYLNDAWKINANLSANLGVRYETVSGNGPTGAPLASSHSWVPRLGVSYDLKGDGRLVFSGSYAEYSGGANPNNFQRGTNVGNPNLLEYLYLGPNGQGRDFGPGFDLSNYTLVGGNFPTQTVIYPNTLHTPNTREWTLSVGGQIDPHAYAAVTYVDRKTRDFIDEVTTFNLGQTDVVFEGNDFGKFDNSAFMNTNAPSRNYQAVALQSRYTPMNNLSFDLNYTYMIKFDGNYEGEATNQPANTPGIGSYPEILAVDRNFPTGRLLGYQKHKLRALTAYSLPTHFGTFGWGMVYRFDSGTPYSYRFNGYPISSVQSANDPGYANPPTSQTIYFGPRGSQTFPSQSRFDLAFNYDIPIVQTLSPWIKATVFNIFNTRYMTGFDTSIVPCAADSSGNLPAGCSSGPVDAHGLPTTFVKSSSFGKARSAADFQTAREFLLSAGIRF
jgi:carboxypeptidase family protein